MAVPAADIACLRFLVVDDHPVQRAAMRNMLAALGARDVLSASEGSAGLALFTRAQPPVDVVITDLHMPGMDGMEFLRHLGASGRHASVVLASVADPAILGAVEKMASAYGLALLGVLGKPVSQAGLAAMVGRHDTVHRPVSARDGAPAQRIEDIEGIQDIARALRLRQFEPFFQPKVELAGGRVAGMEALARWRRPDGTVISPAAFMGQLEGQGLMEDLTWEMLRMCAQASGAWLAAGIQVTVSLNVSASSLADFQFAGRMLRAVRRHGLDPRHFILEITESAAVGPECGAMLENVSRLRLQGFGLSIDDYGTGYSSMQQLNRIPFTELKIDQSFVRAAPASQSTRVILESCLDMARKLGIASVGEGVETREQWDLLARLGCSQAQGYFICRPMQAQAAMAWLAAWDPGSLSAVPLVDSSLQA